MGLLPTDILAILIALTTSLGMVIYSFRRVYLLERENFELRAELTKHQLNL